MALAQQANEAEQIEEIINKEGDPETKKTLVKSIRQSSIMRLQKATTLQTGLSLSTTMMGSTILVLPVLFFQNGIISALIVSLIIAIISAKTTSLLIVHNKEDELDLPDTLLRVLGVKWKKGFIYSTVLSLWLTGMIYQILIINQIYPIIELIADKMNFSMAKQEEFSFSKLSYQWVGIAYSILIFPLFLQRKLGLILKLTSYGTISVFAFVLFTLFEGIKNVIHHKPTETKYVTFDFANLGGVFALALLIQSLAIPILKNNARQKTNNRAIAIGFSWTWLVYSAVGAFGAFAICGVTKREGTQGSTMLDYYPTDNILVIIIQVIQQILIFLQLTLVFPVLQFVTRSQFCGLVYGLERPPNLVYFSLTLFYSLSSLIAQCLNVDLTLLLGLTGYYHIKQHYFLRAIIGLIQEFIVPIALHLKCLYRSQTKVEIDRIQKDIQAHSSEALSDPMVSNIVENPDLSQLKMEDDEFHCNDHSRLLQSRPQVVRFIIYGSIVLLGLILTITQLINIFKK